DDHPEKKRSAVSSNGHVRSVLSAIFRCWRSSPRGKKAQSFIPATALVSKPCMLKRSPFVSLIPRHSAAAPTAKSRQLLKDECVCISRSGPLRPERGSVPTIVRHCWSSRRCAGRLAGFLHWNRSHK